MIRRVLSAADNVLLAVVLVAGGAWTYQQVADRNDEPPVERRLPEASTSEAFEPLEVLATLEVKGRAPKTGYDRKRFGVGAVDLDRNGCDYRNDTLRRDLATKELRPDDPRECVVERGSMTDPYTGDDVSFVRGANPSPIEIDHVVALSDAWQKGAQQWPPEKLLQFGNDPRNLIATSRAANRAKKDSDAATWLPPNRAFRCSYVTRQIEVKAAYGLAVTAAERDAMRRVLADCAR